MMMIGQAGTFESCWKKMSTWMLGHPIGGRSSRSAKTTRHLQRPYVIPSHWLKGVTLPNSDIFLAPTRRYRPKVSNSVSIVDICLRHAARLGVLRVKLAEPSRIPVSCRKRHSQMRSRTNQNELGARTSLFSKRYGQHGKD